MSRHDISLVPPADRCSVRVGPFSRIFLFVFTVLLASGCAGHLSAPMRSGDGPADGIRVVTHNNTTFDFRDGWQLTLGGIEGSADIRVEGEETVLKDTTLSYWDVSSAAASDARGNTTSRFLLTILGVILVIGLAALILYAAFPATDK